MEQTVPYLIPPSSAEQMERLEKEPDSPVQCIKGGFSSLMSGTARIREQSQQMGQRALAKMKQCYALEQVFEAYTHVWSAAGSSRT